MTPEQRFERIERVLGYFVREGRRWRVRSREQDEKIKILIHFQMETTEQINKLSGDFRADLAASHAIHEKEMGELRRSQKLTHQELQALIRSLRKERNGNSSD
ncbi:MAG TPA: hypothetical protein VGN10_09505 [Pyrinomonadaceae bacterium]